MSGHDLTERALRARSSLRAASDASPIPVFTPSRVTHRPAVRWVAPVMAALAAVAVALGALVLHDRTPRSIVSANAVASVSAGQRPAAVAADGHLIWIADAGTGDVIALDARTLKPRWVSHIGSRPVALAYGDGALWVVDAPSARLMRLDPLTGSVTGSGRTSLGPVDVEVAAGSVWVLAAGNHSLDRYDPTSVTQLASAPLGVAGTAVTHVGRTLWVATRDGLRRVNAVDSIRLPVASISIGGAASAVAGDTTGRLWVTVGSTLIGADGGTGRILSRVALSGVATAIAAGTSPVVATTDGRLMQYDGPGATGRPVGTTGTAADALAVSGHLVVGTSRDAAVLYATETTR
jgi:hypothetical protein